MWYLPAGIFRDEGKPTSGAPTGFPSSIQGIAGWVQYRSGHYERAMELLEKAAGKGDATPDRQFHLGMAYLKAGRADEGKALLESAVAAQPPIRGIEEARAALQGN